MRNYIILNGQNSNSISGLLIQSLAPISKPLMRTEIEEIDGRDGDITTKLGYSAYDKEITIGLYGNYDINEVIAYFNSEGTVIFSNEPDKYYNYQIAAQIDFERLVRYKTATVTMHCQPFKYSATEGTEIFGASSNLVTIPNFSRTTNGITVTVSDGLMTVSGKGSAATEFYVPIDTLSLAAGSYTMTAVGSGTAPEACSLRVIYDSPSSANSFGGTYVTLKNNTDVSLSATLSATKTYNYVYLYITGGKNMNFTLNLQIVDQAQATVSDEGTNLVLEGSAEAPFSQFDLKGNTEQQTYSGKNLFSIDEYTNAVIRGGGSAVSIQKSSDNTLKMTNLVSQSNNFVMIPLPDASKLLGKTATVSFDAKLTNVTNAKVGFYWLSASSYTTQIGDFIQVNSNGHYSLSASIPTSIPSGSTRLSVAFYPAGSTQPVNSYVEFSNIQCEQSNSATSYEPYVGGTASPNPDYPQAVQTVTGENVVKITGKNLYEWSDTEWSNPATTASWCFQNGSSTAGGGAYGANITDRTPYKITLPAGTYKATVYDISSNIVNIQACKNGTSAEVIITSPTNMNSSNPTSTITLTEQTTLCFRYRVTNPSLGIGDTKIQVERDSATAYEPYQSQSYEINLGNIELCKIGDYQDYIYKSDGKWYVHKAINKYTTTGSEAWQQYQYGYYYAATAFPTPATTRIVCYSSTLKGCQSSDTMSTFMSETSSINYAANTHTTQGLLRIKNADMTSLDGFKTWLTNNPATIYYVLATPTDTEITNEALVEQLDDIYYHAHAYKERTHVSSTYADGNVPHIIAAAVTANMGDITVTNSGNFISKPTMTIFGSGNIGVYLNGIQLFQIALGDTEYITIDCAAMEAYKDTLETLQNRLVTGDYSNFVLNPGDNTISFSGSVTKFEISNYSRWL